MVQDPTLFTAVEWVLAGLAFAVSLLLFLVVHKAGPGSPFAVRAESWSRDPGRRLSKSFPEKAS